jgi:single-strand DNA-binding protein
MNSITLTGRAGRDPEVRYFESGTMVASLTLAVNRMKRDEDPDWFNLEIWGKQAQVAADYVRKGSLIGVIGSVRNESWTDRTSGEKKYKTVVRVDRLELMGSKKDSEQESGGWSASESPASAPAQPQQQAAAPARQAAPAQAWNTAPLGGDINEDDVPF